MREARRRRVSIAGLLIAACALLVPLPCAAGGGLGDLTSRFTFVPEQPEGGEFVQVREDIPAESPSLAAGIVVSGYTITVTYWVPDVSIPGSPPQVRFYPVGQLAAGTYRVDYIACGNPPPPTPACVPAGNETVLVQGLVVSAVPATGTLSVVALVLTLLLTARFARLPRWNAIR